MLVGAASRACTSLGCWHPDEDHTNDVDFSPAGIRKRWEAGYEAARRAIQQKPWTGDFDPLAGVILHEPDDETLVIGSNVAPTRATLRADLPILATG